MSVLFEGEITLVLAFQDAGGRAVRNVCCRQIWWGIKLHKEPSIWQAVISVASSFGLGSYLPHTVCGMCSAKCFGEWDSDPFCLFLKSSLEAKGANFLGEFLSTTNFQVWFWNGCHVPCDAVLIIHLKSSSGFSRKEDPMNFTVSRLLV